MNPYRASHRIIGFFVGPLVLVAALTAIGLNHKDLLREKLDTAASSQTPFGQYILCSAADPVDPRHILVGTANGLFGTTNGGRTWEPVPLPTDIPYVGSLCFDMAHPRVVYVALREGGIWRSNDGGKHWGPVELPWRNRNNPAAIVGLTLTPSGAMVVTTQKGLWRQARPGGPWSGFPAPKAPPEASNRRRIALLYELHDGTYWKTWGVPITDAVSLALVGLVCTGYGLMFGLGKRRRRFRKARRTWEEVPDQDPNGFWGS